MSSHPNYSNIDAEKGVCSIKEDSPCCLGCAVVGAVDALGFQRDGLAQELPRIDAQIAEAFFRMMSEEEVRQLDHALGQHMKTIHGQGLSPDALKVESGLFRDRYIRTQFSLPELVAIALDQ